MLNPECKAPWTETLVQSFSIRFDYPVHFTRDLFDPQNPCLREVLRRVEPEKRHRLAVFVDEGVTFAAPDLLTRIARYAEAHASTMELAGDVVVIPGGEAVKNQHDCVEGVLKNLSARRIDRQSFAVAIGGGAVLDAVGFAAAIFHRGVRHVRCPTTVLSQDDSGVGVKNGINAFGYKNLLGTFAPPFAVINDSAFIDMLPARDKRGGMAEAVKVALIRDGDFFAWIEREAEALARFAPNALEKLVRRCTELHMHQIAHGGDRDRARHALLGARRAPARGRGCPLGPPAGSAGICPVGRCARPEGRARPPPRHRRTRGFPGASRRRANGDPHPGDRPRRRGPRDGRTTDRAIDPMAQGASRMTNDQVAACISITFRATS